MRKLCFMFICLTVLLSAAASYAIDCYNRDLGLGVSGGYGMLTGADDKPEEGFEERAEGWLMGNLFLKKHFTYHWALAGRLSYGFNYDKDDKAYRTNLVPIDVNFICDFMPSDRFNPYVSMGAGIVHWVANRRPNDPDLESQRDPALALGGGFDVFLNEIIALDFNVTWRYMLTDDKDMIGRSYLDEGYASNDNQLWYVGLGLTWYPKEAPDSDGDGVCDAKDRCPNTPPCCIVDEYGCEIDSDGDGVCDGCDKCPDTPKCATVDAKGCPQDSDGDGVYDGCDKCPGTPSCCEVDEHGCEIDSDGDGVCDGCDECPGTPAGVEVDEVGCPKCDLSALEGITFRFDKSDVIPDPNPVLDQVLEIIRGCGDAKIEVHGHTDWIGPEEYNVKLGMRRAQAVKDYLVSKDGIQAENLFPKSFGESQPIDTNKTKEGRQMNRRVEFHVVD
jgi:OOP family OmpA-OmpF porin